MVNGIVTWLVHVSEHREMLLIITLRCGFMRMASFVTLQDKLCIIPSGSDINIL